jgi:hypothetical protein
MVSTSNKKGTLKCIFIIFNNNIQYKVTMALMETALTTYKILAQRIHINVYKTYCSRFLAIMD